MFCVFCRYLSFFRRCRAGVSWNAGFVPGAVRDVPPQLAATDRYVPGGYTDTFVRGCFFGGSFDL